MSTIAVDNARPSAGGTAYSLTDGVAKAWVDFTGTGTVAINESLNVSSMTDHAVPYYSWDYTSGMASTNYCTQANGAVGTEGFIGNAWKTIGSGTVYDQQTTATTNVWAIGYRQNSSGSGAGVDTPKGWVSITGDLA